jgi:hypothetical protein
MDDLSEKLGGNIKRFNKGEHRKLQDINGEPNSPSTKTVYRPDEVQIVNPTKKTY